MILILVAEVYHSKFNLHVRDKNHKLIDTIKPNPLHLMQYLSHDDYLYLQPVEGGNLTS